MRTQKVYRRQLGLIKPSELKFSITVIGAGGIGSWATLALAKMGCSDITVIDFDTVEPKNTPSQIYTMDDVGNPKAYQLAKIVNALTGTAIFGVKAKFEDHLPVADIAPEVIICAVDSLKARLSIWNALIKTQVKTRLYIDARMAGEDLRIISFSPLDLTSAFEYAKTLSPKRTPHREECTARSVVYNTFLCAGLITSTVKKYAKRQPIKPNIYMDIVNSSIY